MDMYRINHLFQNEYPVNENQFVCGSLSVCVLLFRLKACAYYYSDSITWAWQSKRKFNSKSASSSPYGSTMVSAIPVVSYIRTGERK